MAKTIDEVTLKINVDGTAQIKDSTSAMENLGNQADKTGAQLKGNQGNIRNVAFQIQDMAVQIAGGTNAFIAMGQQIPQLLGGFGVLGAVIGAVAAVAIPLAQVGLKALGIDMRGLDDRIKDATDSVQKFQDASKANLVTLAGMGNQYGTLTQEAKRFLEIQQQLTDRKAYADQGAALEKLKDQYKVFTDEFRKSYLEQQRFNYRGGDPSGGLLDIVNAMRRWNLGLSAEQAKKLGEELAKIDQNKPEEAVETLNGILEYLNEAVPAGSKFRKTFEDAIEPILRLNKAIIDQKQNLKEAAEQASQFNTEMLNIANSFQPNIAAARRGYDQVTAIRLEGAQKIAEFQRQIDEKSSKDQVDRSKEVAAFRTRTEQEVADKIKDVSKNQWEAYRAAYLTNDTKLRQLQLEDKLIKLREQGMYDLDANLKYEEEILRNAQTYSNTIVSLMEQRRKGIITAEQENTLAREAVEIQQKSDATAAAQRNSAIRIMAIKQEMEIMKQNVEQQMAGYAKMGDAVRAANQKIFEAQSAIKPEDLLGKTTIEQQVMEIAQSTKRAAQEAARAFAEGFGDIETPERAQQFAQGLDAIAAAYGRLNVVLTENAKKSYEAQRQFNVGWADAFTKYVEDATNSANQARTIFSTFTTGFEDAMVNFVKTGKLSFKDLANSIIADIVRIQAKRLVMSMFGGSSGGGIFGSIFGGLFRANGGPVSANSPYIVGEKGPELFVPRSSGNIIPNGTAIGGGGSVTNVNYSIQAVDASSFRSLVARDPEFIFNVTEQGRRQLPLRSRR